MICEYFTIHKSLTHLRASGYNRKNTHGVITMATVQEIFDEMPNRFDAIAAVGQKLIFQFDITDGDSYHITIDDGTCRVVRGTSNDPSVTLITDTESFVGIMTGKLDGMQAFMAGKVRTEGNMMLATRLNDFFRNE
ncbi:SCP2 sterol-binding domain-containing protein [Endozoicomonas sp. ALD040]|uniref:SCP2 sterol-binding domain-containing protein n=1 Tax=Endozoicomonas sp. ALD040 TaxID=3403079 RepID=UPI003BAF8A37